MIITTDNYEEYFYQYCEGGLTDKERAIVEAFAAQHPKLAEELSLYDPVLKLEDEPMTYPDKESLMRHEARVVPLWRWAAAACVAAVLIGGVYLMWPNDKPTEQTGMIAQNRQPVTAPKPVEPMVQQQEEVSTIVVKTAKPITQPTEPVSPMPDETVELLPQYEPPTFDEPSLLAEVDPMPAPQQEDTTVIEYIDIMLMPSPSAQMEVVQIAYQPTVRERFRAFRSRVSNTVRDYAYQSYSEARGELLTRIDF
ncbi:MAG: hypothetical protein IKH97_08370 [Bacteroidales bacterium]|nr:hypothetical protein [Bacteroidales bacterium]